jgi:hypothetical protein
MNPFHDMPITEPSKLLYQNNLSLILGKGYTSLDGLRDIEKTMKYINSKKTLSTKRTYISCVITALKNKPEYDDVKRQYQIILKNDVSDVSNLSDEKTDKQEKNWVELSVLKHILEKKQKELFKNIKGLKELPSQYFNDLTAHMVCSLYLLIEPRRNKDFAQMYIGVDTDKSKNYYDVKKNQFIFNNYKTNHTYVTQTVMIPSDLQVVLKMYMKYHSTNPRFILFHGDQSMRIDGDIKTILSNYLGVKNLGVSMLRNIYATSTLQNEKQQLEDISNKIEDIATKMGTSSNVLINQYAKKNYKK